LESLRYIISVSALIKRQAILPEVGVRFGGVHFREVLK
jgi:hypothetical protein